VREETHLTIYGRPTQPSPVPVPKRTARIYVRVERRLIQSPYEKSNISNGRLRAPAFERSHHEV
jgi:hypothetical protein